MYGVFFYTDTIPVEKSVENVKNYPYSYRSEPRSFVAILSREKMDVKAFHQMRTHTRKRPFLVSRSVPS